LANARKEENVEGGAGGAGQDVMVVGSSMVDLLSYLERFPAAGETIFGRSFSMGFGGKGANQAVMAALLGAKVSIVNCVATDVFGDLTVKNFEGFGIDVRRVDRVEGTYSGVASIWVEPDGQNRIVLGAGANEALTPGRVDRAFDELPGPRVVLCQFEVPQPAIVRAFERGRETGATNILNPGPGAPLDPRLPELTDWLLPNETEFAIIAGLSEETTDTAKLSPVVAWMAEAMETNVVVTLGERGALLHVPGSGAEARRIRAPEVEAVDTTGAGDAFAGAFAYAVSREADPVRAVEFACAVAGESVTRPGTQVSYPRGEALDGYRRMLAGGENRSAVEA
jgi:ribokinase